MMKRQRKSYRSPTGENVSYLITQAERARVLAAKSSPLVMELLEIHAQCCEKNAAGKAAKSKRRSK